VLNVSKSKDPYTVPHHRWEPLRNVLPTPTVEWLRRQTEFVAEHRRNGGVVYVHCHGGASRSVLVVAACQMADHGTPRDETLAALRRQRAEVALNPVFLPLLAEWETVTQRR
jgi:protein-tyrosine phosphatase